MGQVSISEDVLADIANALRETLGTSQTFTLPNFYRGVLSIEAPIDHFTWVIDNDDNSYFYLDVWDEQSLTIQMNMNLIGEIDWGDGVIETCADNALTEHSHTYPCPGYYSIMVTPESLVLGGNPCIHGNARVNRYTEYVQVGRASLSGSPLNFSSGKELFLSKHITSLASATVGAFTYVRYDAPAVSGVVQNTNLKEMFGNPMTKTVITPTDRWQYTKLVKTTDIIWNRTNTSAYYWYCGHHGYELHYQDPFGVTTLPQEEAFNHVAGGNEAGFTEDMYWVNFPSNVTSVQLTTRYGDHFKLAANGELHCANPTPPSISYAFNCGAGAKIYVPRGSLEAYQSATNWSSLTDYMEEEPS